VSAIFEEISEGTFGWKKNKAALFLLRSGIYLQYFIFYENLRFFYKFLIGHIIDNTQDSMANEC
jgi:hypothetical protein